MLKEGDIVGAHLFDAEKLYHDKYEKLVNKFIYLIVSLTHCKFALIA